MSRYKITHQHGINFVTQTVVDWVDAFIRKQDRLCTGDWHLKKSGDLKTGCFGSETLTSAVRAGVAGQEERRRRPSWYTSKNEVDVFGKYSHLLKMVSAHLVGLLAKICFEEPVEESITKDLEKILNFEVNA